MYIHHPSVPRVKHFALKMPPKTPKKDWELSAKALLLMIVLTMYFFFMTYFKLLSIAQAKEIKMHERKRIRQKNENVVWEKAKCPKLVLLQIYRTNSHFSNLIWISMESSSLESTIMKVNILGFCISNLFLIDQAFFFSFFQEMIRHINCEHA